jgi:adenylate cyclase
LSNWRQVIVMMDTTAYTFLFADFRFDGTRNELIRLESGGREVPIALGVRACAVLSALIKRPGSLVSNSEIFEAAWDGRIVEGANLSVQIAVLRRVLGPHLIQTVSGRGYRFVAAVRQPNTPKRENGNATLPLLPLPDKPSIAVLPFQNMSGDPEQEYFADSIAEDVITALSRYASLFVIARNSGLSYKGRAVEARQIGRELGVRYILEGSLRKLGGRIRVTAQLVDTETGSHVWAERYDRDVADIFAVQDEISQAVTIAVKPAILQAEQQRAMRRPPEDHDAWTAYLRGLWHFGQTTVNDNAIALELFQKAIDLAPAFGGGYRGLAITELQAATALHTRRLPEILNSAQRLARRAIELDPTDVESRAWLAFALLLSGDHHAALSEAEHAVAINRNAASARAVLGQALLFAGRPREGLVEIEMSINLDRHDPIQTARFTYVAVARYYSGDYTGAVQAARDAIRLFPDQPFAYHWLAAGLGQLGRVAEARDALQEAIAAAPRSFDFWVRARPSWIRPEDHAHTVDGLRKAGWQG